MVLQSCLQKSRDTGDSEKENDDVEKESLVDDEQQLPEIEDPMADMSLQSLIGFTKPKTMQLEGAIAEKGVMILIDSGATNNFITTLIAQQIRLEI